jgi:hypothetical protein
VTSSTPKPGGSVALLFVRSTFFIHHSDFQELIAKLKGSNLHRAHKILKLFPMPSRTQPGHKLLMLSL